MAEEHTNILRWLPWPGGRRLICALRAFHEKTGLDIRLHYFDPETEEWRPTKKGIWIPIEKAKDFHELIMEAFAQLHTYGDEANQPNSNSDHLPISLEGRESGQPSAEHSNSQEVDSEIEISKQPNNNDTVDDPEKQMNEWLRGG